MSSLALILHGQSSQNSRVLFSDSEKASTLGLLFVALPLVQQVPPYPSNTSSMRDSVYSSHLSKAVNSGKWVSKRLALEELQMIMSERASQDIPRVGSATPSGGNPIFFSQEFRCSNRRREFLDPEIINAIFLKHLDVYPTRILNRSL
jgi:hypothetical protein